MQALAALARQSACLGEQQSALLASNLYWSYLELRAFLRLNGLERLVPAVAQAAASALLLFHDVGEVPRHAGAARALVRRGAGRSPRGRGHETDSLDVARDVALRPAHGSLRRLPGHLPRQGRERRRPAAFLDSILSRENLGRYDCSFAEMIERGAGPQGYMCGGSDCEDKSKRDSKKGGQSSVGIPSRSGLGSSSSRTPPVARAQDPAAATAARGPLGGCGDAMKTQGRSRVDTTINCVSKQIVRPGTERMRCVIEGTVVQQSPRQPLQEPQ